MRKGKEYRIIPWAIGGRSKSMLMLIELKIVRQVIADMRWIIS